MIFLLTYLRVFVLHLCRILWAADEMTLGRGGGLVSSQLVQGAGLDRWWLVVGGPSFLHLLDAREAFLSQLGLRFGFEPGNGWSERRYWVVKRAFQEHGQPGFQRR